MTRSFAVAAVMNGPFGMVDSEVLEVNVDALARCRARPVRFVEWTTSNKSPSGESKCGRQFFRL
jgi:hypothetical protein